LGYDVEKQEGLAMENYFQMNMDKKDVDAISNLGLAHIGDAVYELLCRSYLCRRGTKTVLDLHQETVKLVKAQSQAKFADNLLEKLTEEELSYYRRGKNAHVHAVPKGATAAEYAKATGVEALFGMLHLTGRDDRANELFCTVMEELYGL
jgi:ribonuclease-3 family protein